MFCPWQGMMGKMGCRRFHWSWQHGNRWHAEEWRRREADRKGKSSPWDLICTRARAGCFLTADHLMDGSHQHFEVRHFIPILQMRKLRIREGNVLLR